MTRPGTPSPIRPSQFAWRVSLAYCALAVLWILGSDQVVDAVMPDAAGITHWQTYKGLGFVAVTAGLLFLVLHRIARSWQRALDRQHATEQVLSQRDQLARASLDALSAHVAILDEQGRILAVNEAWRAFGVANGLPRDAVGDNYLEVCNQAVGADQADARAVARGIRDVLAGRLDHFEREYACHGPDQQRWFFLRVTAAHGEGVNRAVVAHEDVTPRKQVEEALRASEQRVRQITDNIQEVFWMTDPAKNRVLYVSPAYARIWGRSCESLQADPRNWLEAIHPEDRDRVRQAATTRQARGEYDETYRILRPDGSQRWIRDRAYPIRDASGEVYRVVGTAEDVTEHRHLEQQFREAQKMEAIGTLAGGIAHDFNNILGAILGYAQLARTCIQEQSLGGQYLDAVVFGAQRAARLVRQILAFSRHQDPQRRPVALAQALAEPVQLLRASIPATIGFDVDLPAGLPDVLADPVQMHQVLMNLCTNAEHAMRGEVGRLTVRLEAVAVDAALAARHPGLRPGPYVRLTVADTGRGMDDATRARIFEPFFTTKKQGEGTGLGLAVVHGIVESHDGVVTVHSQVGVGSTFQIWLPALATQAEIAPESDPTPPRGEGQRILFVDDEVPLAVLGRTILEQLGYAVECCASAADALAAVRARREGFDLLITDLTMPGMTGIDLARLLLQTGQELPVIMTTGYNADLTPERARAFGIRLLLQKPLTPNALGEAVRRVLRERTPA